MPDVLPDADKIAVYALLLADRKDIKAITDCTEGLENRIKALSANTKGLKELIDKLETRRYTRARLSRIITDNMLGIDRAFTEKCLKNDLYLKVLAVADDKKGVLSAISGEKCKAITRKSDCDKLSGVAKECFERDVFANAVYDLITGCKTNPYEMKIVKR